MSNVLDSLRGFAEISPERIALADSDVELSHAELRQRIVAATRVYEAIGTRVVGLMADNCVDWIVADLAAMQQGVACVPVPPFFSPAQVEHLIESSGIDTLVVDPSFIGQLIDPPGFDRGDLEIGRLAVLSRPAADVADINGPNGTAKITYTSGSTGHPKGVCLSFDVIDDISARLAATLGDLGPLTHLCVLPLATLLENVAGVYVPLMLGGIVRLAPMATLGLYGSSSLDGSKLAHTVRSTGAESLILQPEILRVLTEHYRQGGTPAGLKFVAVGGARVADADIRAAREVGIPAFQGYGLSECASVVALNRPGTDRPGSVGKPLPGLSIEIDADGEIIVYGQAMLGYLEDGAPPPRRIRTGDLGRLDEDGYLYVTGRKKNVFITSFGRNVSPEWPEAELVHEAEIAQACVVGEARATNLAVLVPAHPHASSADIAAAVARANERLPDYARISGSITTGEPFSTANGLLTSSGKLRREAIVLRYVDSDKWPNFTGTRVDQHSLAT